MVRIRGGLLASTGAIAIAAARTWRMRAPEGEGEAGGAGSSSSSAEEDDFFGGSGGDPKPGEGGDPKPGEGGDPKPGEGGDPKPGEGAETIAEWMKSFSGEKKEGELSHQEWLAKTGVKDLDTLAQIARDNQKALRESGRVKVPGEGATEAEIKAFREAVGAPAEAKDYAVELPAEAKNFEIDAGFLDPMKEIAAKFHIPAAAFKEMGDAFLAAQLQSITGERAKNDADRDATLKEWGPQAVQGKEEFKRGQDVLKLSIADLRAIQSGFGAKRTMEMLRSIGQMAGEDFFSGNNGRPSERFGFSDLASAEKALNNMIGDKDTGAKLRAKDPVTVARYNALTETVAHFKEKAARGR